MISEGDLAHAIRGPLTVIKTVSSLADDNTSSASLQASIGDQVSEIDSILKNFILLGKAQDLKHGDIEQAADDISLAEEIKKVLKKLNCTEVFFEVFESGKSATCLNFDLLELMLENMYLIAKNNTVECVRVDVESNKLRFNFNRKLSLNLDSTSPTSKIEIWAAGIKMCALGMSCEIEADNSDQATTLVLKLPHL